MGHQEQAHRNLAGRHPGFRCLYASHTRRFVSESSRTRDSQNLASWEDRLVVKLIDVDK